MKIEFIAQKKELERALARVVPIADKKSTMPILTHVLVRVTKAKGIALIATDNVLSAVQIVPAENKADDGGVCVHGKTFLDLVRTLRDGPVRLSFGEDDKQVVIRAGSGKFRLRTLPFSDFPKLPMPHKESFWWELPGRELDVLIARTQYAISTDSSRPHLMASLFLFETGAYRLAATDSSRVSLASLPFAGKAREFRAMLPDRGVTELARFCEAAAEDGADDIAFTVAGDYVFFKAGDARLTAKLVVDQFPPYAKIIRFKNPEAAHAANMDRQEFVGVLERMVVVASEARKQSAGIYISFQPGKVIVQAEHVEIGDGAEEVEAVVENLPEKKDPPRFSINVHFLLEAAKALNCERVLLSFEGPLEPVHLEIAGSPDAFLGVIMPLRMPAG